MRRRMEHLLEQAESYSARQRDVSPHRFLEGDAVEFACDVGQRGQLVWAAVTQRHFRVLDCQSHAVCFELVALQDMEAVVVSETSPQVGLALKGEGPDVLFSVSSQENREVLLGTLLRCHAQACGVRAVPFLCLEGQFSQHLRSTRGEQKKALPLPATRHDYLSLSKNGSVKAKLRSHGDLCVHYTDRVAEVVALANPEAGNADVGADTNFTVSERLNEAPPERVYAKPSKVVILSDAALYLADKAGKVEFCCPVSSIRKVGFSKLQPPGEGGQQQQQGAAAPVVHLFHLSLAHDPQRHPDAYVFAAKRGEGLVSELREVLHGQGTEVVNFTGVAAPQASPPPPYRSGGGAAQASPVALPSPEPPLQAHTPSDAACAVSVSPPSTAAASPLHPLSDGKAQARSPLAEVGNTLPQGAAEGERMRRVAMCEASIAEQLLSDRRREAMLGHLFGAAGTNAAASRMNALSSPTPSPRRDALEPTQVLQPLSASPADLSAMPGFDPRPLHGASTVSPSPRVDAHDAATACLSSRTAKSAEHRSASAGMGQEGEPPASAAASAPAPAHAQQRSPIQAAAQPSSRQLFGDDFTDDDDIITATLSAGRPAPHCDREASPPPPAEAGETAAEAHLRGQLAEATARLSAHIEANAAMRQALSDAFSAMPTEGGGEVPADSPAQLLKGFLPAGSEQTSEYFVMLQGALRQSHCAASDPPLPLVQQSRAELASLVALKEAEVEDLKERLGEGRRGAKEPAAPTKRGAEKPERGGAGAAGGRPGSKKPTSTGLSGSSVKQLQQRVAQKGSLAEAAVAYARCAERRLNHIGQQRYAERIASLETALRELTPHSAELPASVSPASRRSVTPDRGSVDPLRARLAQGEYDRQELKRRLEDCEAGRQAAERQMEHVRKQGAKVAADIIEKAKEKAEELSADASSARLHLGEAVRTVEALQMELERQKADSARRLAEQSRRAMSVESELRRVYESSIAEIEERAQQHERRVSRAQAQLLQDLQAKEGELHLLLQQGDVKGDARSAAFCSSLSDQLRVEREKSEHLASQLRLASMQVETLCVEAARSPDPFALLEGGGGVPSGMPAGLIQKIGDLEGRVASRDALIKELRMELQKHEPHGVGGVSPVRHAVGVGDVRLQPFTALRKLEEQEATVQSLSELNRMLQNKVSRLDSERTVLDRKVADMADQLESTERHCNVAVMKVKNELSEEKQRAMDARARLEARSKALETGLLLKALVEEACHADEGHEAGAPLSVQGESARWITSLLPKPIAQEDSRRPSASASSAAAQAADKYDALMEDHLRCKAQLAKAQEHIDKSAVSNARLSRQAKLLQRDIDSAKTSSEQKGDEVQSLQDEVAKLKTRLGDARRGFEEAAAERETLISDLQVCRQRLDEQNIAELERKLLRSTDQFEELNKHFESERRRAEQVQQAYASLEAEHKHVMAQNDELRRTVDDTVAEVDQLKKELATQQAVHERRHQESIRDAIEKAMHEMGVGFANSGRSAPSVSPTPSASASRAGREAPSSQEQEPQALDMSCGTTEDGAGSAAWHSPEMEKIATIRSSLKQNPSLDNSRIDRCVARLCSALHHPEEKAEKPAGGAPAASPAPPRAPSNAGRKKQQQQQQQQQQGVQPAAPAAASSYAMRYSMSKKQGNAAPLSSAPSPPVAPHKKLRDRARQEVKAVDNAVEDFPAVDMEGRGAESPSPRIKSHETAALYAKLGLSQLAPFAAT